MKGYTLIRTIRKNVVSVYGYTLIELLVVLTIIGLLFSFGFVSFRDYSRRQALAGTAKEIQGDLRLAQEDALAGQVPSSGDDPGSLCRGSNTLNGYNFDVVSVSSYALEAVCTGGNITEKTVNLPADTTIAATANPILFKILGQGTNIPTGETVSIVLTQAGTSNTTTVMVSSGGEIQ